MSDRPDVLQRRELLRLGSAAAVGGAVWLARQATAQAAEPPTAGITARPLTPDAVLQMLLAGNQHFVQHRPQYPDQSARRLREVAQAQHPVATILSCADSRVPAELIFDQGIGDLFDVRIAGNIATPEAIGSIEYAVVLLGTPLLMILGHERCGAVTAAVQNQALPGQIGTFVKAVLPAVERVKGESGDRVDRAVTANVRYQMECVQRSPLLQERLADGRLKVVGGRYDLDTGAVTLV